MSIRMEGYEVLHCRAIRCPFESICRDANWHTDRSNGCATQNYIISEAQRLKPSELTPVVGAAISGPGTAKIGKIKQLRAETGVSLREAKDALDRCGYDLEDAKRYIEHGW